MGKDSGSPDRGVGVKSDGDSEYLTREEKRYVERILGRGQVQMEGESPMMDGEYPQQGYPGGMGYGYRDFDETGEQMYPGMNIHNHHYSQEQAQLLMHQQNPHLSPSHQLANMQRQSIRPEPDDLENPDSNLMRNQGACIYETFNPSFNQMTMQKPSPKTYNGQYKKSMDHIRKTTNKGQRGRHQLPNENQYDQGQNQNFDRKVFVIKKS
jgi:hypothetical protein